MAKRPQKTPEELEAEVMNGIPDRAKAGLEEGAEGEGKDKGKETPKKDPIELLTEQVKSLQSEVVSLRASKPKTEEPKKPEPEEETDWDKLIFENPAEAVKLIKQQTRKEVEDKVRKEYTSDQQQREFWRDFYAENKDLADDDDLVKLTLNANLKDLQDLPVGEASKRLAELTRDRIVRYSGGRRTKKVEVEGGGNPNPKPLETDDEKVVTMGDLIRRRREKRRLASVKGSAA